MFARLALPFAALALSASSTHAAIVTVFGDLGNASFPGTSFSSASLGPPVITTPFTVSNGNGTLVGDVVTTVFTNGFYMRVTNLTYSATSLLPITTVTISARHSFLPLTPGQGVPTLNIFHTLTGSQTGGPLNSLLLDTQYWVGGVGPSNIPTIAVGSIPTFNSIRLLAGVTNAGVVYDAAMTLTLTIDGSGAINLPNSADFGIEYVPSPGALSVPACLVLFAARRRRR